jgi:hypothetical protein
MFNYPSLRSLGKSSPIQSPHFPHSIGHTVHHLKPAKALEGLSTPDPDSGAPGWTSVAGHHIINTFNNKFDRASGSTHIINTFGPHTSSTHLQPSTSSTRSGASPTRSGTHHQHIRAHIINKFEHLIKKFEHTASTTSSSTNCSCSSTISTA